MFPKAYISYINNIFKLCNELCNRATKHQYSEQGLAFCPGGRMNASKIDGINLVGTKERQKLSTDYNI